MDEDNKEDLADALEELGVQEDDMDAMADRLKDRKEEKGAPLDMDDILAAAMMGMLVSESSLKNKK